MTSFHTRYRAGSDSLADLRIMWIGRDQERFRALCNSAAFKPIADRAYSVDMHPNPCFPGTIIDEASGGRVVADITLLDAFVGQQARGSAQDPASIGCVQSHRRAWWHASARGPNSWWLFVEDDCVVRPNALERLIVVLDYIHRDAEVELVALAGADQPEHQALAVRNSDRVGGDHQLVEIRTIPCGWTRDGRPNPIHVGLGNKMYLLSPAARRRLNASFRVEHCSIERDLWKFLLWRKGPRSEDPRRRVLYASPSSADTPRTMATSTWAADATARTRRWKSRPSSW